MLLCGFFFSASFSPLSLELELKIFFSHFKLLLLFHLLHTDDYIRHLDSARSTRFASIMNDISNGKTFHIKALNRCGEFVEMSSELFYITKRIGFGFPANVQ